ncbi:TRAP transporter substrate-binding protein [Cyanobacterium sp. Dongsha4]|uniref:TRAP transporter substrate-binding protein n=1 Tax=Cyanobacterium sp. DS4 TaxID=2878255 RepID=UPI002E8129EE|nr:TRAP transporter substrate-binding protein [Cyanobacterium sp. Dongsha4]WVL01079.1 TRAP transporter substrate-binding protein [Cyanobacterium sp. Dongsha4]
MQRRQFLTNAGISAVTSATLVSCQSQNNSSVTANSLPEIKWRMVTSWPKSLDTIYGAVVGLCDRLKAMSSGKFQITPYAAGEIVPGLEVLDTVQNGTVECGHTASYYYIGKNSALAFGTGIPFGLLAGQHNAWWYYGGGLEAMQKVYSDFNIINFPAGNTGAQMGGWFKREVKSLADLKGLKMRIPGLGGEVMGKLGVTVQNIPGGEVFLALDRGAIDAAEWVGPYDDEKLGLNKVAQYYYYPGWWEPGPSLEILINKSAWEKLPTEYQNMMEVCARESNITMLAHYDFVNQQALKSLIKGGTKLVPFPQDILQQAEKISFELYESNAQQNPTFKEIYQSWLEFRKGILQWNSINELSFANFVNPK